MHIHRSRRASGFAALPNALLQDRRLSYTARGILVDLLSRPDGWLEDGKRMADTSPQGRGAVARALRELTRFGYYRVDRVRRDDGTLISVAHVYDTPQSPQSAPGNTRPDSGEPGSDPPENKRPKNREKVPTLPEPAPEPSDGTVATLLRVVRREPRLRLGVAEARALAPLVEPWLERGYGERELVPALLDGLPVPVHSAAGLLRDRLVRKLPPARPAVPRLRECDACGGPTRQAGVCRGCAGTGEGDRAEEYAHRAEVAIRGLARVRAVLRGGPAVSGGWQTAPA
ncbi:hypothetical protein [Streptomyces sp. NPDC127098]|uniref:hypothetical protein n=1 Tax=Streptomyces sp. NPDC127098 TaxID=3347137 RepID=UPI00365712F4